MDNGINPEDDLVSGIDREPFTIDLQEISEVDFRAKELGFNPELMKLILELEVIQQNKKARIKDQFAGFIVGLLVAVSSSFILEWTAHAAPWLLPPMKKQQEEEVREYLVNNATRSQNGENRMISR